MWDINYENRYKFHISIGIGLVVAAFFILFSNMWLSFDRLTEIEKITMELQGNVCSDPMLTKELNLVESKLDFITRVNEWTIDFAYGLVILGAISVLLGYIWWAIVDFKKSRK